MNINRLMTNMDNMARTNDFSENIFGPGGTQFQMMDTNSINDFASEGLANPLSSDESLASPFSTLFSNFIGGRASETGVINKRRMTNQQISIRGIRCTNISLPGRSFVTTPCVCFPFDSASFSRVPICFFFVGTLVGSLVR